MAHRIQASIPRYVSIDGYNRSAAVDAFNRLRVSTPTSLLDAKLIHGKEPDYFLESTAHGGDAIYNSNEASVTLSTTSDTASYAARQTKRYFNYRSGKSHLALMTFNFRGPADGCEKSVGYFDDDNGLFLRLTGNGLEVVRRTSVSGTAIDNAVPQASWSIDPCDGTGPSGYEIDTTTVHILIIDFQWLGVGAARIGFLRETGDVVYVHQFEHVNSLTTVYMSTPNLPIRWEIKSVGTTAGSSMEAICCNCACEGGADQSGIQRTADRGVSLLSTDTTLLPLVSIRNKTANGWARGDLNPLVMSILATTVNTNFRWALILNPTITGGTPASWVDVEDGSSHVEYDITATGTVSGGQILQSGYAADELSTVNIQLPSFRVINCDWDGTTPDMVVLAVQCVTGAAKSFLGSLSWLELI